MHAAASHDVCWACTTAAPGRLVCAACGAPQPLARDVDLFAVLGLPRHLALDRDDVERRWHELSRLIHPDRHQAAGGRASELSVAATTALNQAVRTLREPIARGRYWLELHGAPLGRDNNRVPPSLAALVFETQERLEELRAAPHDAAVRRAVEDDRRDLQARLAALEDELRGRYAAWDAVDAAAPAVLEELKRRLSEIAYLTTLEGDVTEALDG